MILKMRWLAEVTCQVTRKRICVRFWYGSEFVRQEGKGRYVEKSALDLTGLNQSFGSKSSTLTPSTQDH